MLKITQKGDFDKTTKFLAKMQKLSLRQVMEEYGRRGVDALSSATPVESGVTAASWGYEIHGSGTTFTITWTNSHLVGGVPLVILLQFGHGTRNGGYVQGRDFINPAIRPVFDKMLADYWKEVTQA